MITVITVTTDYTLTMTVLSIRFKRLGVYERLKRSAAQQGESISSAAERLIDEGLRMEAYPGIVFRDGPAGKRAALATGPDVWQVVPLLKGLEGSLEERIAAIAEQLWLNEMQVRAVSRYYAEFTDEIDAEIAENDEIADRELAAWENERKLLTG